MNGESYAFGKGRRKIVTWRCYFVGF